jgi:hypothetical protein
MEEIVSLDEKIHIVNQFIRNLSYSRYNLEVSLIAENAVTPANDNNVKSFNLQIKEIDLKIKALQEELSELEQGA